jgi:CRISPR-associated endonuclease/helicase Cas3
MKVRDVIRLLASDGWVQVAPKGSHRQFKHPTKPGKVTVPGNFSEGLPRGTYKSILRQATPRRLIYCLPMRTPVEQTGAAAQTWLRNLEQDQDIRVYVLMGGERTEDWDVYPGRDAILIGTQDMLLCRALNRGYGMSRYRWPMHFGLLNNGCLWVLDEIQLMGSGLATSTQLQAFRDKLGAWGTVKAIWMSATLRRDWLATVDFKDRAAELPLLGLSDDDRGVETLGRRLVAKKHIDSAPCAPADVGSCQHSRAGAKALQ